MIHIAILGFGTVGGGVWDVIRDNQAVLAAKLGQPIEVKYVLDLREFPDHEVSKVLVHDFAAIENDPEVSIVVETMGGAGAAYRFVKAALLAGKSVATSNKVLVAEYGTELMAIAREKNVSFLFEASCGGGIPVIRPINCAMNADVLDGVAGILNGTTNYILTMMSSKGAAFDDVLKEAQQKGYAEADPTADIEGHDAQRKIAILSSLAYQKWIPYRDVPTEGITKITTADMDYAKAVGCAIKLLGRSSNTEEGVSIRVAPFFVPAASPLYAVNDVFNGIYVHGNMVGDTMFYGSGAGKLPTASAVVGDVVEAAMNPGATVFTRLNDESAKLVAQGEQMNRFFVRVEKSAAAAVEAAFGKVEAIELATYPGEFGFITESMREDEFAAKREALAPLSVIRMMQ